MDFSALDLEEQLIVEREIMMSIMGQFIDDKNDANHNFISIESDLSEKVKITES